MSPMEEALCPGIQLGLTETLESSTALVLSQHGCCKALVLKKLAVGLQLWTPVFHLNNSIPWLCNFGASLSSSF